MKEFADEFNEEFQITLFESGTEFLTNFSGQYDLILMDIDMPGISGIDAIDYVIKPVSYPDFDLFILLMIFQNLPHLLHAS